MQIDLIITELEVGGAERSMTTLATHLQAAGDDVRVFSIGPLPISQKRSGLRSTRNSKTAHQRTTLPAAGEGTEGRDQLVTKIIDAGIEVTSGDGVGVLDFPRVSRELSHWVRRRPDAIRQSFLFHANVMTSFASWTLPKSNTGVDVSGVRVAEPNSRRIWLERQALRRAEHVVCVSSAVEAFVRDRMKIPAERTSVIRNCVDVDRFAHTDAMDWCGLGWPSDSKVVLFVGRFHSQKNLELLQQHLDEFAPYDSDRKLVLIGQGPQRTQLEAWADSVPGDRVRVMPWQADTAPWMKAAEVLVLPSHYEGMPNVVLEAMATAKPVVCSRVEGSQELIGDDADQGFAPNDGPEMADRLNQFLSDKSLADRIGKTNQERMRKDFSVQSSVASYRSLYERLS